MRLYLLLLAFVVGSVGILLPEVLVAQEDSTAQKKIEDFRKQNRIRSLETEITSKLKDVDIRFAKKKILKETDAKTGKTTEKEVIDYRHPQVYEKGMIVFKELNNDFKTESKTDAKIAKGEAVVRFLDKMIALYQKDTEKLEKQLKKEKDTTKLKELIEKGL